VRVEHADITIAPEPGSAFDRWRSMCEQAPNGTLLDRSQHQWRELTRQELGLAADRPIIATGHQTLLWHPGILAKYLAMDAAAAACGFATATLVVDQHIGAFAEFEAPIRLGGGRDGALTVRRIELGTARKDVPMALHPPLSPNDPPDFPFASESVAGGVQRIIAAVRAHRDQPNAALQMAHTLADLMQRWVAPAPNVTATNLVNTTLGRALLEHMADDPHRCVEAYNRAVAAVPEAGIGPLLVRDEYVELPLWRIRPDARRMRAYDNDAQAALDDPLHGPPLLPRALFMTALVRLGMCDLFIHGTGGARYDRAMELWVRDWLGVEVAPIAVATATLRLPLMNEMNEIDLESARHEARRAWHDPDATRNPRPGHAKRAMLAEIDRRPRNTLQRRSAFHQMHDRLEELRIEHSDRVNAAQERVERARRVAADADVAQRRDWPFPLYPDAMIDEIVDRIGAAGAPQSVVRARS
jgi:hypothetical protein